MKKTVLLLLSVLISLFCMGQVDVIFHNNERIPCIVKEITEDAVKFVYPGEEVLNTMYKNTIQQIVFKNGRVQTFAESTYFRPVRDVREYENVTISYIPGEVRGLFKVGEVDVKTKATPDRHNQERIKQQAYRKMKMMAAMMGANVVLLRSQRPGNSWNPRPSEDLTGIAYTNILPDFDEFMQLLRYNANNLLVGIQKVGLLANDSEMTNVQINKVWYINDVVNENGLIIINRYYRVVGFDSQGFNIYYKDKSNAYNIRIIFDSGRIVREKKGNKESGYIVGKGNASKKMDW